MNTTFTYKGESFRVKREDRDVSETTGELWLVDIGCDDIWERGWSTRKAAIDFAHMVIDAQQEDK
jgi:hypothetical protein